MRTMRRHMMILAAIGCLLAAAIVAWDLVAVLSGDQLHDPWEH